MIASLEHVFDTVKYRMRRKLGIHQLRVVAYPGFRNQSTVFIRGRVLAGRDIERGEVHHGWWRNFGNMAKRFFSTEIAHAILEVRWNGGTKRLDCDNEGFYYAELPIPAEIADPELIVRVVDPEVSRVVEVEAPVWDVRHDAEFITVSDLDDTVIRTWATRIWRMLKNTLFHNATTRVPFDGVDLWYRRLRDGNELKSRKNPLFYVSSSPWNLYDFIEEFLQHHNIPSGPMFLKDHGLNAEGKLTISDHVSHKRDAIEKLLHAFPDLPLVLIGDSGQKDPEVYQETVRDHPGRVRAVFIRNVSSLLPGRVKEVERLGRAIGEEGTTFQLFDKSVDAVKLCEELGLIPR